MSMKQYLSTVTADKDITLSIRNQGSLNENPKFEQEKIVADVFSSDETVMLHESPIFTVNLQWLRLSEEDSNTIKNLYYDPNKANGSKNSFKWEHPIDANTYVVKFVEKSLTKRHKGGGSVEKPYSITGIKLRILGNV